MRIGVLDVLRLPARTWAESAYDVMLTKQYASLMPQAIAVWCRRRGHRTFYGSYWGLGDPRRLLPRDLDLVFIASYTQASALAYALAKLYRRDGVRTVLGGPHARAFPADALRFFDVVVGDCDEDLVADVVRGVYDPGTFVSGHGPAALPSVEERLPEIRGSAFLRNRPYPSTTIPLLASVGCPYACDFCVDWDRPYRQLPHDRLAADLRAVAAHVPGAMISFHDPNFAIKFDAVLDVLEDALPPAARPPYIMESSLAVLRPERARRLAVTNCAVAAPGIESWTAYSAKAGTPHLTGAAKVARVVEHFRELHEHVPYLQANFLFGGDDDRGDEPVELTRAFMRATPFVWPVVNIPHPFGGTPLFDRTRRDGRLLETLPFSFYYSPYLATVPRHYDPAAYYARLIRLFEEFTAPTMLLRRLRSTSSRFVRATHLVRTNVKRRRLAMFRRLAARLARDRAFRAFHEGRSRALPEYYRAAWARMLGPFAEVLSPSDAIPILDRMDPGRRGRHGSAMVPRFSSSRRRGTSFASSASV
jgi:hypothetical protein